MMAPRIEQRNTSQRFCQVSIRPLEPAASYWRPVGDRLSAPQQVDHLGNGEDRERHGGQRQPVAEIVPVADDHPELAGRGRTADRRQHHADPASEQPLQQACAGKHADHGDAEDGEQQKLACTESQHQRPRDQDGARQHDRAEHAADERGGVGRTQRAAGLALLGHGEAVQNSGLRGAATRNTDQHRHDRVAGRHDGQQADHHGDAVLHFHAVDEGNQQRHAGGRAE